MCYNVVVDIKTTTWIILLVVFVGGLAFVLWQMSIPLKASDFTYVLFFSAIVIGLVVGYILFHQKKSRELKFFEIVKKIQKDWKENRNEDLFIDDSMSKADTTTVEELNKRFLTFHFRTQQKKPIKIRWDTVLNDICGFNYDMGAEQLETPFDKSFDPWKSKSKVPIKEKETIKEIYGKEEDGKLKDKKISEEEE